ncbi:hypothetical protein DERF_010048 [Dermatophagoides farinae]|uniref:Uncharacterized protein n=1 Tax=Dermatophagoides farinae TaxID=6954 RepID=A0A922L1K3_DERFA|nr:hypothetical protein DERF_010048 [Dermatophagoides farinae]
MIIVIVEIKQIINPDQRKKNLLCIVPENINATHRSSGTITSRHRSKSIDHSDVLYIFTDFNLDCLILSQQQRILVLGSFVLLFRSLNHNVDDDQSTNRLLLSWLNFVEIGKLNLKTKSFLGIGVTFDTCEF